MKLRLDAGQCFARVRFSLGAGENDCLMTDLLALCLKVPMSQRFSGFSTTWKVAVDQLAILSASERRFASRIHAAAIRRHGI